MFSESDLASLARWPDDVLGDEAVFISRGFSYQLVDNRTFTEMSSGPPLSRLTTRSQFVNVSGSLKLSQSNLSYFYYWFVNEIDHGNAFFKISLRTGFGEEYVVAKFKKNGLGRATESGRFYIITCQLLALRMPGMDLSHQDARDVASVGALSIRNGVAALDVIVNGEW